MKKFLVLALFMSICIVSYGQSRKFWYDASGNRISRKTITLAKSESGISDDKTKSIDPISDEVGETSILIYPNPTKGLITIEIQGMEESKGDIINLYDQNGRLVRVLKNLSYSNTLDLSGLQTGVYFMVVRLGNNTTKWSIIKE